MRNILKEPLLHFLVLGAALFLAWDLLNPAPAEQPGEIVVRAGQVEHMATRFAQLRQRPPTTEELKGLIDQYVREEILSREARRLNLDRDDAVIRQRLQQKMEFLATDLATLGEPTENELADWLATNGARFARDPELSFRHVYLRRNRRGERFDGDAAALLATLRAAGPGAPIDALGDGFLLPLEFAGVAQGAVAAQFGPEFAAQLVALPVGQWSGPIRSGYGAHLVFLTARTEGGPPTLAEVREVVRREVLNERRVAANRRLLEDLLARYAVRLEWPSADGIAAGRTVAKSP